MFATKLQYKGEYYILNDVYSSRSKATTEGHYLESSLHADVVVLPKGGKFGVYAFVRQTRKNPKGEVDSVSACELELFIENHENLYRQMFIPIVNNLLRKMKKGTYNPLLAEKGFLYLIDEGARRYNKEFGDGSLSLKLFDVPTRKEVARRFARSFEEEIKREGIEDRQSKYGKNPKRRKKNPPLLVIGNPPSLLNIEKSAFRHGEYVGYADGVWRIFKWNAKTWRAVKRDSKGVSLDASTLTKLSTLLSQHTTQKENPPSGDIMSDSVHEVRYTHREDKKPYKHTFKKGVRMKANKDGSVTLYHPTKRIHEEFPE